MQTGHSVAVAEKHDLGAYRSIPHDLQTLEAAMDIELVLKRVITRHQGRSG